ncbi:MAG: penicillin-binding protein activator, partial [Rhodospirillales bacterium]|nr:penicillin-binding protein activator [Rhodospirillales bacterium]
EAYRPEAPPPPPRGARVARVALLLPLSGPASTVGRAMQDAAQLAMFSFADEKFELLFHDTGGTPEGARAAAQMAIGDGADLILGPLLAPSVRAVADAARAANLPVIAFSSDRTVAGGGIYTMGFFPHAEVNRVVRFARARGLIRFAALAPANDYGRTVVGALENVAAAVGAVVVQVSYYDPLATDFSPVVRQLANYGGRRQALIDQRAALEARDDDIAKRALERLRAHQTIGDLPFDALLVADGGKRLQAVAALLPFYDIDPKKVQMLGTGQWDEAGTGAEPALVGGWYAAPAPEDRKEFESQYTALFGKAPHRLATLAYDATALAAVLARSKDGPDMSHRAITSANGFAGRDGIFRFPPEGVAERGLAVLKAQPQGAEVISKSPETFEPAIN